MCKNVKSSTHFFGLLGLGCPKQTPRKWIFCQDRQLFADNSMVNCGLA